MSMHVADTYIGNKSENDAIERRVQSEGYKTVAVTDDQRRRSRFRTTAEDGTEIGVVVGRELQAGDVLSDGEMYVVVTLESVTALVVDLSAAAGSLTTAVSLGHAAGNRHWDMAVRESDVLFARSESRERMEQTIEPQLPEGATLSYEDVQPSLFDDDHTHGHSHGDHEHAGQVAHSHSETSTDNDEGSS